MVNFAPAVNARELHLYSKADGTCTLKIEGEKHALNFTDVLEVLVFLHALPEMNGATLTVYETTGSAGVKLLI